MLEREIENLKDQLNQQRTTFDANQLSWKAKERNCLDEISQLKQELEKAKIAERESRERAQRYEQGRDGKDKDKYYLRVEGERLEEIIKKIESGSSNLNSKLDEILSASRRANSTCELSSFTDVRRMAEYHRQPTEDGKKLELSHIVLNSSIRDFITEYAFRIIMHFS
jgi:uncharacterized coiled-coil DUF342 family protein